MYSRLKIIYYNIKIDKYATVNKNKIIPIII